MLKIKSKQITVQFVYKKTNLINYKYNGFDKTGHLRVNKLKLNLFKLFYFTERRTYFVLHFTYK